LDLAAIHTTGVNADCCISSTVAICTVWSQLQYVYSNCTSCYQFSITQGPNCSLLSKCGKVDSNRTFSQIWLRNISLMHLYIDGWVVGWRNGRIYRNVVGAVYSWNSYWRDKTSNVFLYSTMRTIYYILICRSLLILLLINYN
jgi:hypothetical protein